MGETVVSQRSAIKLPKPIHLSGSKKCVAPEFDPPVGNYLFRNYCK